MVYSYKRTPHINGCKLTRGVTSHNVVESQKHILSEVSQARKIMSWMPPFICEVVCVKYLKFSRNSINANYRIEWAIAPWRIILFLCVLSALFSLILQSPSQSLQVESFFFFFHFHSHTLIPYIIEFIIMAVMTHFDTFLG